MERKTYVEVISNGVDLFVGPSAEPIRPDLVQDLIHIYAE